MVVGWAGALRQYDAVRSWSDLTSRRAVAGVYWKVTQPNRLEVG